MAISVQTMILFVVILGQNKLSAEIIGGFHSKILKFVSLTIANNYDADRLFFFLNAYRWPDLKKVRNLF